MTQFYIGVKKIEAWPEEKDGQQGYAVKYSDNYTSWSPKDVFEKAYLPTGVDGTKITKDTVDAFMGEVVASKFDEKTTIVVANTLTGFKQYEVSSCVDPANYDEEMGKKIGKKRIEDTLWKCLGFVLQWANYGLKNKK